ncbi:unnamed protein product [Prorocentrum cordatum]|uniref:Peptidase M12B domain-containing protein n=1 Tax=Prorocentrum cordatum TaxID=2364126 RepID=A0ABN9YKG3_9DINO|nr:unnamed protein product [Polarella glacialis]
MAELSPAAPLQMSFISNNEKYNLQLERVRSPFTRGARIINGKGETVPGQRVTDQPVFRSANNGAVLSPVKGVLRGLVRMNGSLVDVEADPATGRMSTNLQVHTPRVSERIIDEGGGFMSAGATERIFDSEAIHRWTDCYEDDYIKRQFSMGVSLGDNGAALFTDAEDATEWMQSIFAMTNMVYEPQLNIALMIDAVYIPAYVSESTDWASCASGISQQLDDAMAWSQPSRQGLWHVFDDCFTNGQAGTVGLAVLGSAWNGFCAMDPLGGQMTNVGVTYITSGTWLTFAHEVGHNPSGWCHIRLLGRDAG